VFCHNSTFFLFCLS